MLTIGDFARHGRVSVRMLRHYDAIGLLRPAHVDPRSGYRFYSADQLARLNRVIALKDLGFTLAEIRELLELSFVNPSRCEHIRQRAEGKIADIETRIRSLRQMKRALAKIVGRCRAKNAAEDCPLVHKAKRRVQ